MDLFGNLIQSASKIKPGIAASPVSGEAEERARRFRT